MIISSTALNTFLQKKQSLSKIAMVTAYDYSSATILEEVKTDIILVGDTLGVTILGYDSTREVTLSDMVHHLKAVVRGAPNSFIVCDLPVDSYKTPKEAVKNSKLLMKAGCHSVKLEGCLPEIVKSIANENIPVMGHIGLTPQTVHEFKVQGKRDEDALRLKKEAILLQDSGCFAIVLECVSSALATCITKNSSIPTIGIGAGAGCNGQVLVYNDLLGIFDKFKPKFVRRYKELKQEMVEGCSSFIKDVRDGSYPSSLESYK